MKVYFDESYPENKEIMILGALFLSDDAFSVIYKNYLRLKAINNFRKELKYSQINSRLTCDLAKASMDMFTNLEMPYFCACILPYSEKDLKKIIGNDLHSKRIGLYVDSAKKLIMNSLLPNSKIDLFMDQEERVAKTKFAKKIKKMNPVSGSKVSSVQFVDSSIKENSLIQICDLLTGAILQAIYPSSSKSSKYKREFSKHVLDILKIKNINEATKTKTLCSYKKPKFCISYWKVPDFKKHKSLRIKKEPQLTLS